MEKVTAKLTVMFEDPFWVGVYERRCERRFEVCKITFGAEPKDYQVYDFLLRNYRNLKFSPALKAEDVFERRANPKRLQRSIKKQLESTGIGTKAQQALKLLQEQNKTERKIVSRETREKEKERRLELSAQKRREKHKGH